MEYKHEKLKGRGGGGRLAILHYLKSQAEQLQVGLLLQQQWSTTQSKALLIINLNANKSSSRREPLVSKIEYNRSPEPKFYFNLLFSFCSLESKYRNSSFITLQQSIYHNT